MSSTNTASISMLAILATLCAEFGPKTAFNAKPEDVKIHPGGSVFLGYAFLDWIQSLGLFGIPSIALRFTTRMVPHIEPKSRRVVVEVPAGTTGGDGTITTDARGKTIRTTYPPDMYFSKEFRAHFTDPLFLLPGVAEMSAVAVNLIETGFSTLKEQRAGAAVGCATGAAYHALRAAQPAAQPAVDVDSDATPVVDAPLGATDLAAILADARLRANAA